MDELITRAKDISLSGDDLYRLTDGKCEIYNYEQLMQYNNIDEILGPNRAAIVLYETAKNYGHWVCMFVRDENKKIIEFFDPYGTPLDDQLNYDQGYHLRLHNGVYIPHLTLLLADNDYIIKSNTKQLQEFDDDINTCGRWVAMRIITREASPTRFINMMTKNKGYSGDQWVTILTYFM